MKQALKSLTTDPKRARTFIVFAALIAALVTAYTTFNADFLIDHYVVYHTVMTEAEQGAVPVTGERLGLTRASLPGAVYYYVLLLPYRVLQSPRALQGVAFVMGIATALVFLLYIRRKTSIHTTAFLAFLFLCNPTLTIMRSAFLDFSFVLLPFLVLFIFATEIAEGNGRTHHEILILPVAALAAQTHIAAAVVLPFFLLFFFFANYHRWHWRNIIIGAVIALALYAPYLVVETRTGFANTRALFTGVAQNLASFPQGMPKIILYFLFPTNEISCHLGSGIKVITDFYFRTPQGVVQFVFNVATVLFSLVANVLVALYLFFGRKKRVVFKGYTLSPFYVVGMTNVYFLLAALFLSYILFFQTPPAAWTAYTVLALPAFLPILALFEYLRKKRPVIAGWTMLFFAVNVFVAISVTARLYITRVAPLRLENQKAVTRALVTDAKGAPFTLTTGYRHARHHPHAKHTPPSFYEGIAKYFVRTNWNASTNDGAIPYIIEDPLTKVPYPPTEEGYDVGTVWDREGLRLLRVSRRKMTLSSNASGDRPYQE